MTHNFGELFHLLLQHRPKIQICIQSDLSSCVSLFLNQVISNGRHCRQYLHLHCPYSWGGFPEQCLHFDAKVSLDDAISMSSKGEDWVPDRITVATAETRVDRNLITRGKKAFLCYFCLQNCISKSRSSPKPSTGQKKQFPQIFNSEMFCIHEKVLCFIKLWDRRGLVLSQNLWFAQ